MGDEFVTKLTELLFELHIAATPDKLNKVGWLWFITQCKSWEHIDKEELEQQNTQISSDLQKLVVK